jgi:glutamyl-tRNA synthetase
MLTREEARPRVEAGEPYVIRMKVPTEGECVFTDALRGEIRIPWVNIDHQILLKSDGFPTYHLANVVDDHLMGITHVIRGEEWINSAPKHLLLYRYFGWQAPELIHMPLLRNPDKSKLSKRKNPTSINYYRRAGFLPEAVLNYLGLMGYSLPDEREFFSLAEMIESFDIGRVSLGGPVFDIAKLTWLNGRYLRERMAPADILGRLKEWMLNDETIMKLLPLAQPRIEKLTDFIPMTAYMFTDRPVYDPQMLVTKGLDAERVQALLKTAQWEMEKVAGWSKEAVTEIFTRMAEKEGLKMKELTAPFYVALSGATSALPLYDTMAILGSDMTRRRIQYALEALGTIGAPLSEKKLKKLEKEYQEKYGARG